MASGALDHQISLDSTMAEVELMGSERRRVNSVNLYLSWPKST